MFTLCLAASAALFFSLSLYFEQKCRRLTRELESASHRAGLWHTSFVRARMERNRLATWPLRCDKCDLPYRLTQEVIEKLAKE